MLEQDYKLLAYIQSQPRKRLNKIQALSFSPSVPANRARIDELKDKKYIRETTYYIDILPKGEKALEDYLLEQNRQQQPQEPSKKNYLPFGLTVKEIVLYLGFPLILMLVGFWLNS